MRSTNVGIKLAHRRSRGYNLIPLLCECLVCECWDGVPLDLRLIEDIVVLVLVGSVREKLCTFDYKHEILHTYSF